MSLFNIDWDQELVKIVPVKLRKAKLISLLRVGFSAIKAIWLEFEKERAENLYKLKHGQSVTHVQAVLNDAFDPVQRRIYIYDPYDPYEPIIFYQEEEEEPVVLFQEGEVGTFLPWYQDEELETGGTDFIIVLPDDPLFQFDEARLRALVEEYKLPGKTWVWEI